jgi:hypothetical protein
VLSVVDPNAPVAALMGSFETLPADGGVIAFTVGVASSRPMKVGIFAFVEARFSLRTTPTIGESPVSGKALEFIVVGPVHQVFKIGIVVGILTHVPSPMFRSRKPPLSPGDGFCFGHAASDSRSRSAVVFACSSRSTRQAMSPRT